MRRGSRRGSRIWYAEDARPIEGACGVTSTLICIELCETERRRLRSEADFGGPAPVPLLERTCIIGERELSIGLGDS